MKVSAPRATLSVEAIQTMLNAAVARSQEHKVRVHISIYDSSANLAGFISFDGAPQLTVPPAHRKAFTSASLGMTTEKWESVVNSLSPPELKIIDSIDGYIAAKGGYPIIENGLVLGGIGVSGANQEIDADIAEVAIAALGLTS